MIASKIFRTVEEFATFLANGITPAQVIILGFNAKGETHVVFTEGPLPISEKLAVSADHFGKFCYLSGVQVSKGGQIIFEGPNFTTQIETYRQVITTIVNWLAESGHRDVYMAANKRTTAAWLAATDTIISGEPIQIQGYLCPRFYSNGIVAISQNDGRLYFAATMEITPKTNWSTIYADPDGKVKYLSRIKANGILYLTTDGGYGVLSLLPLTKDIVAAQATAEIIASMAVTQPDVLLDVIDEEHATGAFVPQATDRSYALAFVPESINPLLTPVTR